MELSIQMCNVTITWLGETQTVLLPGFLNSCFILHVGIQVWEALHVPLMYF